MREGTAEVPHPIAAAYLPEAASVFDAATALATTLDMVDPQPTLVELLVRHVLRPRELLPQIEINSNEHCSNLFLHVASFLCRGMVVPGKAWSFHAQAVSCFNKGKAAHGPEFGRAFQLGRIGGNFLVVGACTSIRMEDKAAVRPMIEAHQGLFGQDVLWSFGTDKGYYSQANHDFLCAVKGLKEFGLQQPGLDIGSLAERAAEVRARLADRRAGIEPLIGHAKHGGQLGQSRMKTDETTLAAGYSAIGGFNLRQLIRHLLGKDIKPMG